MPNLTRQAQGGQGVGDLRVASDRRWRTMKQQPIDMIEAQSTQGGVQGRSDLIRPQRPAHVAFPAGGDGSAPSQRQERLHQWLEGTHQARLGRKRLAELGDDKARFAPTLEGAADRAFAVALTIYVGGVEERDAELDASFEKIVDLPDRRRVPEGPDAAAPEAKHR